MLISAFDPGGAPHGFRFQTQLSDPSIVVAEYYNQSNSSSSSVPSIKLPATQPGGYRPLGPGNMKDPRNRPVPTGDTTAKVSARLLAADKGCARATHDVQIRLRNTVVVSVGNSPLYA